MAKTLREDLEDAWDNQVIKEAQERMKKREGRSKSPILGKAGAMGVVIQAYDRDLNKFKDGDAAYDHVMNMDESIIEDAQRRLADRAAKRKGGK